MKQLVARAILMVVFGGVAVVFSVGIGDAIRNSLDLPSNLFTAFLFGASVLVGIVAIVAALFWAMLNAEGD